MFERHHQAVSRIRDQDVSVDPTLQLMVEGTNAEIALQAFECRLDLRQLFVTVKLWRVTSCPAGGRLIFSKPNARPACVLAEPTRIYNWSRFGQLRRMARSFRQELKAEQVGGIGNRPLLCRWEGQADWAEVAEKVALGVSGCFSGDAKCLRSPR